MALSRKHRRLRNLAIGAGTLLFIFATMAAMREDRAETTTVILVRHAEKAVVQGDDPPLSETGHKRAAALRHTLEKAGVSAIFVSQFQRTQQTVEPLAKALKIAPKQIEAVKIDALVSQIRQKHRGETILIAGHSNTIPAILKTLEVNEIPTIADSDYDDLFVVTIPKSGPPRLLHLQYGEAN